MVAVIVSLLLMGLQIAILSAAEKILDKII